MSAKYDQLINKLGLNFEDDWHLTKHFWEWPKVDKEELNKRLMACDLERSRGCQRPNIAPCKRPWVYVKFYFSGDTKPHTSKVCESSPKGEHWGHLFGWTSGWKYCEILDQEGNVLRTHR